MKPHKENRLGTLKLAKPKRKAWRKQARDASEEQIDALNAWATSYVDKDVKGFVKPREID